MPDNRQIKDGLGNLFTIRMRDISPLEDSSIQRSMIFSTLFPVDYSTGGCYHRTAKSGVMAPNIAAKAPIYSFQWPSVTTLALIRRVRLSAWSVDTGFTAGLVSFDMLTARAFSVQLTGGTQVDFTSNNGKLRTSMGSSQANIVYSNTAALTGGTYTLDTGPGVTDSWPAVVGTNPYTPITMQPVKLFEKLQGEMPLLLSTQEGFIVQATVPQTGTWGFTLATEWDEVPPNFSGY